MELKKTKINNLVVVHDSKRIPLSSLERAKRPGCYPYYGATGILDYVDDYLFDGHYILLGEDGTVITKSGKPVLQFVYGKFWVSNHAHILTNSKLVTLDYLYYLLMNTSVTSIVTGAVQPKISQANLLNLEVFYHEDLTIQAKIAHVLKKIDEKILINDKTIANLEEQGKNLFESWFVSYEKWGGDRPSSWSDGKIGDYVTVKRGGSPRPISDYIVDEGLNWLKIADVTDVNAPFIFDIKEKIKPEGLKKTVFIKKGSLVLSNSATPGIPKIIETDTCIHDGWLYFINSKLSNEFLYLLFKCIRKQLVSLGNGSVFTNLKKDIVIEFPFPIIPEKIILDFDTIIKPYFDLMLSKTIENNNLIELRNTLLPKLMSGEIDVSKVKIEE